MFGFLKRKSAPGRVPSVPEGTRVYAVGDIHGRLDLLDRLHAIIVNDWNTAPTQVAHLIYLGDYVDRGPNSAGVLERLSQEMFVGFRRTLIGGNHEEMLLAFLDDPNAGTAWRQLGGLETLLSYRVDVPRVLADQGFGGLANELAARIPDHHLALLKSLTLATSVGDYFFCHAGVRPGVPLSAQTPRDLRWIRQEFLSSDQDFGAVVVHGHSPTEQPDVRANRINIDTGAYATGCLTCLVLEGETRRFLQARG